MKAFGVVVLSGDIEAPESKDVVTREADSMKDAFSAIQELTSVRPNWKLAGICHGEDLPKIMEGLNDAD